MDLYHYTCGHSHKRIGEHGTILPAWELYTDRERRTVPALGRELTQWSWFTDLPEPIAEALGLDRVRLACDRTEHRYRVVDDQAHILRYVAMRRALPAHIRQSLETHPGAMPMHWWATRQPVSVAYDPVPAVARG